MTDPITPDFLALAELRGRITLPHPMTGAPVLHVWQKTTPALANNASEQHPRLQLRIEPGGRKGNTLKQQRMRAAMTTANADWHALSAAEKQAWNKDSKRYGGRMNGYTLFIRNALRGHP